MITYIDVVSNFGEYFTLLNIHLNVSGVKLGDSEVKRIPEMKQQKEASIDLLERIAKEPPVSMVTKNKANN